MTRGGVQLPGRALAALDEIAASGTAVLVHGPPAMGVADVVGAWLAGREGCAVTVLATSAGTLDEDLRRAQRDAESDGRTRIVVADDLLTPPRPHAVVIGPTLFVLDPAEIRAALAVADPDVDAGDATVQRLYRLTSGWPRLANAALQALQQGRLSFDGSGVEHGLGLAEHAVRELMRGELMPRIPPGWNPALEYLASGVDANIAEFDDPRTEHLAEHLGAMLAVGVATRRSDRRETLVRLPDQIAQAVRDGMRADDPKRHADLLRLVTQVRYELGTSDCGLSAAYELRDLELCARIIERWVIRFGYNGHRDLSHRVMLALPERLLRASPLLAHRAEAYSIFPVGSIPVTIPTEQEAHEAYRAGALQDLINANMFAIAARRLTGRVKEARGIALRGAPMAELMLAPLTPLGAVDHEACPWFIQAAMACLFAGDEPNARRLLNTGWRGRDRDTTGWGPRDLAMKHAVVTAFRGEPQPTLRWLADGRHWPEARSWLQEPIRRSELIAQLVLAVDALDTATAARCLSDLGDPQVTDEMWPYLYWALARHELAAGEPAAVLATVEEAPRVFPQTAGNPALHARLLHLIAAEAHLARGDGAQARSELDEIPTDFLPAAAARVRLHLLGGRAADARTVAADLAAQPVASPRVRTDLAVLQAAAEARLGDTETARATARRAAILIDRYGIRSALAGVPATDAARLGGFDPRLDRLLPLLPPTYPDQVRLIDLSPREALVLRALANGLSQDEVAAELFVSRNTVKTQIRSLYAKLGVHSRQEALARAIDVGLLGR